MRLLRRLAYWLRLSSHHADLMDELAFHREMIERDLIARGMSPADARTQARRTMGNETLMREERAAVWLWPSLEALWQDATYTLRDLRRNPDVHGRRDRSRSHSASAPTPRCSRSSIDCSFVRPRSWSIRRRCIACTCTERCAAQESETGGHVRAVRRPRPMVDVVLADVAAFTPQDARRRRRDRTRELRNVAIVSASFFGFFDAPPVARTLLHGEPKTRRRLRRRSPC